MKKSDFYPFSSVLWITILGVLYAVGAVGMPMEGFKAFLLPMTPVLLILTTGLLTFFQLEKDKMFWLVLLFVFVGSIVLEIAGVSTGVIFGEYVYGDTLGPKVYGVPVMIGVNWVMLVLATGMISMRLHLKWWKKAVVAASLMVFLDMWMEPLCGYMDMWYWDSGSAPVKNYLAWWAAAFVFQVIFQRAYVKRMSYYPDNPLAFAVWLYQFLFFAVINLIIA